VPPDGGVAQRADPSDVHLPEVHEPLVPLRHYLLLTDEAGLKVELSAGARSLGGDGATVTVSASAHLAHGPREEDAEALGALVQRFLELGVARMQRAFGGSAQDEWRRKGGGVGCRQPPLSDKVRLSPAGQDVPQGEPCRL
jgi:hypothetical protein